MTSSCRWAAAAGLGLSVLCGVSAQAAQSAPPADPPVVVSQATLERIRKALASEPTLVISAGLTPTFYAQADGTVPTFSTYLKGWVPPPGSHGGGIDVIQLVRNAIRSMQQAQREREARQIRARIDQELLTLYGIGIDAPRK